MNGCCVFFALFVCGFLGGSGVEGFHAKIKVLKDGSIEAEGLKQHSNFNKTCIKNDYCTYEIQAPGLSKSVYASDKSMLADDNNQVNAAEDVYKKGNEDYMNFTNSWAANSDIINKLLDQIESINRKLPFILDAVEASLNQANETAFQIGGVLAGLNENVNPCYSSALANCVGGSQTSATPQSGRSTVTSGNPVSTAAPASTASQGSPVSPESTVSPPSTLEPQSTAAGPTGGSTAAGSGDITTVPVEDTTTTMDTTTTGSTSTSSDYMSTTTYTNP